MRYLVSLVLLFIIVGCYQPPKINEDIENLKEQEFLLDSFSRTDSLSDLSAFQNKIKYIVVHTFASTDGRPWSKSQMNNLWDSYGWSRGGYHMVVQPNGNWTIDMAVDDDILTYPEIRNGVKYHNHESIHLSWIGGYTGKDTRTPAQKEALVNMIIMLKAILPNAQVVGHRDFPGVAKSCPNFNAKTEYKHF